MDTLSKTILEAIGTIGYVVMIGPNDITALGLGSVRQVAHISMKPSC